MSLKGHMSCIEVEWAKFNSFFVFLSDVGPFLIKRHLMDINRQLVHVDAHFKHENAAIFEIRC